MRAISKTEGTSAVALRENRFLHERIGSEPKDVVRIKNMAHESSIELPEASTRIYIHKESPLLGQSVSALRRHSSLKVEILEKPRTKTLIEGSEIRVSGTSGQLTSFLKKYF